MKQRTRNSRRCNVAKVCSLSIYKELDKCLNVIWKLSTIPQFLAPYEAPRHSVLSNLQCDRPTRMQLVTMLSLYQRVVNQMFRVGWFSSTWGNQNICMAVELFGKKLKSIMKDWVKLFKLSLLKFEYNDWPRPKITKIKITNQR